MATLAIISAIVLAVTQGVKVYGGKLHPAFKDRTVLTIVNILGSLGGTFWTATQDGTPFSLDLLRDALILAATNSGLFEMLKTTGRLVKPKAGASVSVLALLLGGCITVPYKGDHQLDCVINTDDRGYECQVCKGDVPFENAGKRKVESTHCFGPAEE